MNIQSTLYHQILQKFHYTDHEIGGLLLIKNEHIVDFIIDQDGHSDNRSYHPSIWLAHMIEKSIRAGYETALIHCHPGKGSEDTCMLSKGDEYFAQSFMKLNKWNTIDMVIVSGQYIKYFRCMSDHIPCCMDLIVSDLNQQEESCQGV